MNELRIAHIADTHLGYRSGTVPGRDEDFAKSWIAACSAIRDAQPDVIIHAGDLFHHPHPSWGAVYSFIAGTRILQEARVPILMISGNHDFSRLRLQRTVFSVLMETFPDIYIANDKNPVRVSLREIGADVVLLPHPALLNTLLSKRMDELISTADAKRFNVLVAHGDIKGGGGTRGEGSEMGSTAIPELVFDFDWDYIALGHLHAAQPFGPRGWYSGSIERCGWSDYPAQPAWTLTTLAKGRPIRHIQKSLPHRTMRQLPPLACRELKDGEIIDYVLQNIEMARLGDDPALLRIILEEASLSRTRLLERLIREAVKTIHPKVTIQVAFKKDERPKERDLRETKVAKLASLEEMFRDYVAGRTYPPDGLSQEEVRERGLGYLKRSFEREIEADTGDERTAAVH